MAKQLKKFCRITKYVEKTDPKLFEIISDLCLLNMFHGKRGNGGVTFIWPAPKTMKLLHEKHFSMDVGECVDILLAHVVYDYLPTAAAWRQHASDLPMGNQKSLELDKSATGSKVKLADGAELELDEKFKPLHDGARQVVWRIKSGELNPAKYTKRATYEHSRPGQPVSRAAADAPVDGAGVRHHVRHTVASLVDAAHGGNKPSGPYDYFVKLFHAAREIKDQMPAVFNEICIYMSSPLPVSTLVFLGGAKGLTGRFVSEFRPGEAQLFGLSDFKLVMQEAREHLRAQHGMHGGGQFEDIAAHVALIVEACHKSSEAALQGVELDEFDADRLTRLNLSRMAEAHIFAQRPDQAVLVADWVADFQAVVEVISQRVDQAPQTDLKVQSLGVLILSMLKDMSKFSQGAYAKFPFCERSAETAAADYKLMQGVFADASLASVLASLSPDQLSTLFSNIRPSEPALDE